MTWLSITAETAETDMSNNKQVNIPVFIQRLWYLKCVHNIYKMQFLFVAYFHFLFAFLISQCQTVIIIDVDTDIVSKNTEI